MTVGVLPQRTNLPYKTTSAFRTPLWLTAGSPENGHANSFPASLLISGAKRFWDHMLISIFHLRREDIAWPAFNSQSPGGWMNSLSAGSHTQQPYLHEQWTTSNASKNRRVRSLLCETNYTSTADSSRSTFLILLYIRAHVSVHFPTLNLSGLGGNLKPCSINFYSGSDSSRSKNSHRVSATSCLCVFSKDSTALSLFPRALSFSSPFSYFIHIYISWLVPSVAAQTNITALQFALFNTNCLNSITELQKRRMSWLWRIFQVWFCHL